MILKIQRLALVVLGVMILSSCTQMHLKKPTGKTSTTLSKTKLWNKRQAVVAKKAVWNLDSKNTLRYKTDHWNFGIRWLQKAPKQYVMEIKNPVTGGLVAKLSRNNSSVTLLADDGKTYRDSDEERLLFRQAGVKLPVKGMQHWVRGLSSPLYKVDKLDLDAKGRPKTLQQAGWIINYSKYVNNNYNAMPRKVVITRNKDNVYLKMIVKKWQGL